MIEPPPDVVAPEHREIWYAACRLLEKNADLIALAKVGENGDDGWHNNDMEQEHASRKARGVDAYPLPPASLPNRRRAPLEDAGEWYDRLSATSQAIRGVYGNCT